MQGDQRRWFSANESVTTLRFGKAPQFVATRFSSIGYAKVLTPFQSNPLGNTRVEHTVGHWDVPRSGSISSRFTYRYLEYTHSKPTFIRSRLRLENSVPIPISPSPARTAGCRCNNQSPNDCRTTRRTPSIGSSFCDGLRGSALAIR